MLEMLGKIPSGDEQKKIQQSPNFKNGAFQNPVPTQMLSAGYSYPKLMLQFFNKSKDCYPPLPLPAVKTNLTSLPATEPSIVWFGHSSYLIKIDNKTILVDPVFSGYAAPFSTMNKAFAGTDIYKPADMPFIDTLVITHDHYDHLDYFTVKQLLPNVGAVYTSLGVASHLLKWGYSKENVYELDWYQTLPTNTGMRLTAVPGRHFSGRTFTRNQTLWSGFVLETKNLTLFLGGDSGYAPHFSEIGQKYGPFNLAILECGQYNLAWHDIHMLPEETAQAALDLKAEALLPVHWAKFCISLHAWDDPIKRIVTKANQLGIKLVTPMIGEPLLLNNLQEGTHWWEFV